MVRSIFRKNESGLTAVELIIALTLLFLISLGVFQLFKLGFNAIDRNASAASKNGYSSTFSNIVTSDLAKSDGFLVSSATYPSTKKSDICSSWNKSNLNTLSDFSKVRPLFTVYEKHATVINYARVSGGLVTYYTNTIPDFLPTQIVTINGLTSTSGADFNLVTADNVKIESVNKINKPYSFTVSNSKSLADNTLTSPTTTTATTTAISGDTYTLDGIMGIGNDMTVSYGGQTYVTTNVDPVAGTIKFIPSTSSIPANTLLTFTAISNGIAETYSYVGYELRSPVLSEGNNAEAELWRITCQILGQPSPDPNNSTRLRTGLPTIDSIQSSDCGNNWLNWGCAIRCPQVTNVVGRSSSPFTERCPSDVYISSGNSAFMTKIGAGGASSSTDLFLANSFNFSSAAQVGMSVNYVGISSTSTRAYITAVDLTDPSGDARITIACVDGSNSSSQQSKSCPNPPAVGEPVTIGASIFVICSLTTSTCSTNGTNSLDVNDVSLLSEGMYIDLDNGSFAVLGDTAGNLGSQNIVFSQIPSNYSLPKVLEFHRPTGIRFWIPKSSDPKGGPEQIVVAGRASA